MDSGVEWLKKSNRAANGHTIEAVRHRHLSTVVLLQK